MRYLNALKRLQIIPILLFLVTLNSCSFAEPKVWYVETGTVTMPNPEPLEMKPVKLFVKDANICMDSENYFSLTTNLLNIERQLYLIYHQK